MNLETEEKRDQRNLVKHNPSVSSIPRCFKVFQLCLLLPLKVEPLFCLFQNEKIFFDRLTGNTVFFHIVRFRARYTTSAATFTICHAAAVATNCSACAAGIHAFA